VDQRRIKARLDDILEAISGIQATTHGVSFTEYAAAWHLCRATERGIEIISEASRSIPEALKAFRPEIPWRQLADIGNLLRHEYQRVEPLIIWNIVQEHLPPLEEAIKAISAEIESG
jgi:uncharacterized protein with HEPN domain